LLVTPDGNGRSVQKETNPHKTARMLNLAEAPLTPPLPKPALTRRVARALRPSVLDLRFKGDAYVVDRRNGSASVCLGDYRLLELGVCPLDLPALNRVLGQLRLGQARRQCEMRRRNAFQN
jgi:hypothetical protein